MTLAELLRTARERQVVFAAHGDCLTLDTPSGALTDELRAAFAAHKATLLAMLRPTTTTTNSFVTLKGGLTVPFAALNLAWELETRGFQLTVVNDDLVVEPHAALSDGDQAALGRWRRHVAALVQYECPKSELPE
jgi:TubC N-terminal docking domain